MKVEGKKEENNKRLNVEEMKVYGGRRNEQQKKKEGRWIEKETEKN